MLTMENGETVYEFNLDEGLNFTPDSSDDENGDGIVTATLDIYLNPELINETVLDIRVSHPFEFADLYLISVMILLIVPQHF